MIATCLAWTAVGCDGGGGDLEKVVVSGTVTYAGQLIENGEIRFYPIEGTRGPVSGAPIRAGQYIAQGKGGVPVGKHRVVVQGFRPSDAAGTSPEGGPVDQYIPKKFNVNSTLMAVINGDTETLDFNLTDQ